MSVVDKARKRVAEAMLGIGALLLLIGAFTTAGWRLLAFSLGGMLLAFAGIIFASIAIIEGVPWLVRLLSRLSEPKWDGEILHTDGDEYKIRYDFGDKGSPRFIASDVCAAAGSPAPTKDALLWSGVSLLREGKYAYFGEADVQTYLALRAVRNHAAKRLLLLIRNGVLHKVEKQREDAKRYEQEQG
jgi:hypothetical protein